MWTFQGQRRESLQAMAPEIAPKELALRVPDRAPEALLEAWWERLSHLAPRLPEVWLPRPSALPALMLPRVRGR